MITVPKIFIDRTTVDKRIFIQPTTGPGPFPVGEKLGESAALPISYVSPEFEKSFFPLREAISVRDSRQGWVCSLKSIAKREPFSISFTNQSLMIATVYFLIESANLSRAGLVTVAIIRDYEGELRQATFRWGGKGWILRSYPFDFPGVMREGRHFLYKADTISR